MAELLKVEANGVFELDGQSYQVPEEFTPREIYSYHRLLEPIPDIPGGTSLSAEQRSEQRAFLLRRAAACIIPGLQARTLEPLSLHHLQELHSWIAEHRADLAVPSPLLQQA